MMMNNDNDDTNNSDNDQQENNEIEWEEFMVDYWKNDDNNKNNSNTPSNNVTSSTAVGGIPNGTTVSSHPLLSYIDKETNRGGDRLISSHDNDNNASLSSFLMMLPCELSPEIDDERIYNALSSVRMGCMDIDMDTNSSSNSNRGSSSSSTADHLYYNNNNNNNNNKAVVLSQQFLPNNNNNHHTHHTTSFTNIDILSRVGREFSTIALLSWSTATAAAKNSSSSSSSGNYEIQIADELAAVAAVGRRMKQSYTIDLGVPVCTSPFTFGED
jgi:hypothetical protein